MTTLRIILCLMLCWHPLAGQMLHGVVAGVPAAGGATCTGASPTGCIFRETFEGSTACWSGSSYTNCNNGTWVNTFAGANAVYTYATSPAPLQGSYSLRMVGSAVTAQAPFTATDTVYVGTIINFAAITDYVDYFRITNSAYTERCAVEVPNGTTTFYLINSGGTGVSSASGISAGTTYYIQLKAIKGTGTNAECHLLYSTTGAAGSWTTISSTNGTWTDSPAGIHANAANAASGAAIVFDDVRVSGVEIAWN